MSPSYLLLHSPVVGPSTWLRVAKLLETAGSQVAVPDLTGVARAAAPYWPFLVAGAVGAADDLAEPIAVVGHSGAGAFLPSVGVGLGSRLSALVFVDAVVPPESGAHETPDDLRGLLDAQTVDGMLKPWLEWWPPLAIEELLPIESDRALIAAGLPRLPRDFYEYDVPVPDGWSTWQCAYLRLSEAYDAEYSEARRRGWARLAIEGTHLTQHTDPEAVVSALTELLGIEQ